MGVLKTVCEMGPDVKFDRGREGAHPEHQLGAFLLRRIGVKLWAVGAQAANFMGSGSASRANGKPKMALANPKVHV